MSGKIVIHGGSGGTVRITGGGQGSAISLDGGGAVPAPPYHGPYEFTPGTETQTAHTAGRQLSEDIIIHPVPQNYGLVTYNGSIITIT